MSVKKGKLEHMYIGVNTYGIGKPLAANFDGTLDKLRTAGITCIEPCIFYSREIPVMGQAAALIFRQMIGGGVFIDGEIEEKITILRRQDFRVDSLHLMGMNLGSGILKRILPELKQLAEVQHIRYFVVSPMISTCRAAQQWARELSDITAALKTVGAQLLLHNHEMELSDDGGDTVLEQLMRQVPDLGLELDVGWAYYAGYDCLRLMETYADRIPILHFKDFSADVCSANRSRCFTAVGEGAIPLASIVKKAAILPKLEKFGFIIDQDWSQRDILEDVARGAQRLQKEQALPELPAEPEKPGTVLEQKMGFSLSLMTFNSAMDVVCGKISLQNIFAAARNQGIRRLDMMMSEIRFYGMETVRACMTRNGLSMACLIAHIPMRRRDMRAIRSRMEKAICVAQHLDCKTIMIVPFDLMDLRPQGFGRQETLFRSYVAGFRECVAMASRAGITLCFENTPDPALPLATGEECLALLQQVPGLSLVYDTANMLVKGQDPIVFYQMCKPYIIHVHLKDVAYTKNGPEKCADGRFIRCVPWGVGVVPIGEIMERMKRDDYHQTAAIEYTAPRIQSRYGQERNIQTFFQYLFRVASGPSGER